MIDNNSNLQKPITYEQLVQLDTHVWTEFYNECASVNNDWAIRLVGSDGFYLLNGCGEINPRSDKYGQSWRCWADIPTNEERKAAIWAGKE